LWDDWYCRSCERQRQRDGCESGVCDSGNWVETDQCIPFLHEHGEPVRDDHVVFVLVGSGFGDNEWEDFIRDEFAEDIPEIGRCIRQLFIQYLLC